MELHCKIIIILYFSEILNFSGMNHLLDEELLDIAVFNNCAIFLEEMWDSNKKFGNFKSFNGPKLGFIYYLKPMVKYKKIEMASEAIKYWQDIYKEDGLFDFLLENDIEELMIDLVEVSYKNNSKIKFDPEQFGKIIRFYYFLLKSIVGKSIYKDFISSDMIQKSLIDPLRKGQTILPAIECYNMIDEHLLNITDIEIAGKVLLDFTKTPKKFTFCRYPLLLCCLVCEFANKCKIRFPVYESFFTQIYNAFSVSGQLFVDKIRKDSILEYHLNQKDLRGRTSLQIMSQNRLYHMLEDSDVAAIIGKYWSGSALQLGFISFSCFSNLIKLKSYDQIYKLSNFSAEANKSSSFIFNYYSYRDISSIRYYFKEIWHIIIVLCYMTLIYLSVQDGTLAKTKDGSYSYLESVCYYGVYTISLNKALSLIYFLFVDKWWKEIDNNILDFILLIVTVFHFENLITWFIIENTENMKVNQETLKKTNKSESFYEQDLELSNSISLSIIILIMWFKVFNSFNSNKIIGGFIRTMILLVKKMFFIVVFFYAFILMCTGIFNMYFGDSQKFNSYLNAWFYLFQASLQQFDFGDDFGKPLKFAISIYMIICTSIMINLIIAYSTNIYKSVDENVDSEYRASLIEIYEYFRWNKDYGLFKFFHAPFNVIQFPLCFFVLIADKKKYWTNIFSKILYFFLALLYFIIFCIINIILMVWSYIYSIFYLKFRLLSLQIIP